MPTLFENYAAEIESSQGLVQVSMYDTPGDNNYSHIRPLSYPDTDILFRYNSEINRNIEVA